MFNKDIRVGAILFVIFLFLYLISFGFEGEAMTELQTGPGFFPRKVLLVAMGLTILLVVKAFRKKDKQQDGSDPAAKKRVIGSMILSVLFAIGAVYLGTYICVFLLTLAIMLLWGVRNPVSIVLNSVLTPVGVYLIFTKVLLVQFPHGILF